MSLLNILHTLISSISTITSTEIVSNSEENRKFYIDGEIFGFAKRMTEAQDLKSSVYQNKDRK